MLALGPLVSWRRVNAAIVMFAGCWTSDAKVDGRFTSEEWAFISSFTLPDPEPCPDAITRDRCDAAVMFGKHMFFAKGLEGELSREVMDDPYAPRAGLACVDCHATDHMFIDTRSRPGQISIGASYTAHNALSLVNSTYKATVATRACAQPDAGPDCSKVFSWNGQYADNAGVLQLALTRAMGQSPSTYRGAVASLVEPHAVHAAEYDSVFANVDYYNNVSAAFDAYERRLVTSSRFDDYIAGDPSALADDEKRGLEVFIGKGMCVDCHRPPLFSDLQFHDTGVIAGHAEANTDNDGLAATSGPHAGDPDYRGQFLTPPLRNVRQTAPYMHAGQLATLREVIQFYRDASTGDGVGTPDPRIQPLDLTDDEASDLEAFLDALDGKPLPSCLTEPNTDICR